MNTELIEFKLDCISRVSKKMEGTNNQHKLIELFCEDIIEELNKYGI